MNAEPPEAMQYFDHRQYCAECPMSEEWDFSRPHGVQAVAEASAQLTPDTANPASHVREAGFSLLSGYLRSWRAMTMRWIWLVPS